MKNRTNDACRRMFIILMILLELSAYLTPMHTLFVREPAVYGEETETISAVENTEETVLQYQSITAQVPENAVITLDGMMPENAEMTVSSSERPAQDIVCAYDISISDTQGNAFQPTADAPIRVEISCAAIGGRDMERLHLWHIDDAGVREEITDFTVDGNRITFEASGFSLYEITDGDPALCTYEFYVPNAQGVYKKYYYTTNTGKQMSDQIIKKTDSLIVPQLPSEIKEDDEATGSTFIGWYIMDDGMNPTDDELNFEDPENFSPNGTVRVGAVYAKCAYLIFHDQWNDETNSYPIVATRRGILDQSGAIIQTNDITVSYDDDTEETDGTHMVFKGWSLEVAEPGADAPLIGDTYSITENTDIYPVFQRIAWLNYYTGDAGTGAETLQPVSYDLNTPISKLPKPAYRGYVFEGWYADKELTRQVSDADGYILDGVQTETIKEQNGDLYIQKDTTLYAKWIPGNTTYTVMIWRQSQNDPVDAAEKTYDYADSIPLKGITGQTAGVANTYKGYGMTDDTPLTDPYYGFYYARCDDAKQIAANGSTILNVYYDRTKVTYEFYDYISSGWSGSWQKISDMTGLYNQRLTDLNYTWPSDKLWYMQYNDRYGYGTIQTYLDCFNDLEKDGNHTGSVTSNYSEVVQRFNNSGSVGNVKIIHMRQKLDGTYTCTESGNYAEIKSNGGTFYFSNKFNGFTVTGYSLNNYTPQPTTNAGVDDSTQYNNTLYVYHARNRYTLTYLNPDDNTQIGSFSVPYEDILERYQPSAPTPPPGYTFGGWTFDPEGKVPADLSSTTMPTNNMVLYAKWEPIYYLIQIDPNGGQFEYEADNYST